MTPSFDSPSVSSTKQLQKGTENSSHEHKKSDLSKSINGRSDNNDLTLDKAIQSTSKRKLNTSSSDEKSDSSINTVSAFFNKNFNIS